LIGVFARKNPSNIFLLVIYGLLLRLRFFAAPATPLTNESDGRLYREAIGFLKGFGDNAPFIYPLLAFLLHLLQAIYITNTINGQRLVNRPNYLPGMCYMLLGSFFPSWNMLSSALIASTLLVMVYHRLNRLQTSDSPKIVLFNCGLLLGVANFVYSYAFIFIALIFIALIIYRTFRPNEYLVSLLGFFTPYYLFIAWQYLRDQLNVKEFLLKAAWQSPRFEHYNWQLAAICTVAVLILGGIYVIMQQSTKMLVQARNAWSALFCYLLLALPLPFLNGHTAHWALALTPVAAFAGAFFTWLPGKHFKAILHWLLLALAVGLNYYLYG
jgi:hypothetical protein